MQIIDSALDADPKRRSFLIERVQVALRGRDCDLAYQSLDAVPDGSGSQLLGAQVHARCSGSPAYLDLAWRAGYGRDPDLLAALAGYRTRRELEAIELAALLSRMQVEGDQLTLHAWLAVLPADPLVERQLDKQGVRVPDRP